ncbi:hypothetical protein [Streptomyces triticiradicis]|uniref:Uncharacterized protein n=1 Tax=Streptomyces triticiradicis TaxID=2651189 RepID=A0A7J5DMV3_9ACTN|nr:hypothetical protein [Streptomyces triticiradicis]KAB1990096.1 hypothetical protein F8144_03260 [Streptomyces triticiradicis]
MVLHIAPRPPGLTRRRSGTRRPARARSGGPRVVSLVLGTVQALLLALVVVPFTVLAAAPAHALPPNETPFLTWNMQGATTEGVNL